MGTYSRLTVSGILTTGSLTPATWPTAALLQWSFPELSSGYYMESERYQSTVSRPPETSVEAKPSEEPE